MAELNPSQPAPFGQADLSNCDREPIHLAGSVQPHGAMLLLSEAGVVLQCSANAADVLGGAPPETRLSQHREPDSSLLGQRLTDLVPDCADALLTAARDAGTTASAVRLQHGAQAFDVMLHRSSGNTWVTEWVPAQRANAVALPPEDCEQAISLAIKRITAAASIGTLADAVVSALHQLSGHDRVMLYRFDADGHGSVIAEARDPRLPPLLGQHYPASDIPKQARALYVLNRVRVLVDVDAVPSPLQPPLRPDTGQPLDMSWCHLRTMSPIHLQYLRNMGVTASLSASIVRDGQLWGLIAMHHHAPRGVSLAMCSAIELLAEVVSTRVAAIENYAHAQVSLLVRRLEQRLIDATTVEGDWRLALLRAPQTLLSPLEASGAALAQDGDILTTGEVPSTAEMRELLKWVGAQPQMQAGDTLFACSSVERANPALSPLTPTACGVLAVRLSHTRADWLMWFRKEQLHTVTWAGDPNKPTTFDPKDFSQISPRRSFAAWSELVRGTAVPWTIAEQVTARAIGAALVDIIVQVHAVRMLIAESQLVQIRATVNAASEPVMVANPMGEVIFANQALQVLCGLPQLAERVSVSEVFEEPQRVLQLLAGLERQPWRGECQLKRHEGPSLPVSVRMESVPGRDGKPLGVIVSLTDLRGARQTAAARLELESSLNAVSLASAQARADGPDAVMGAILTNSSLAAMDVADVAAGQTVAPLLQELQSSVERSAALYRQIKRLSS